MEVHRGEVFYADLSPVVGSEQGGIRTVRAGRIPPDDMRRVDEALGVSMGLESQNTHDDGGYF